MNTDHHLRPFYIAKMLYEQTDENHDLTNVEIRDRLKKDFRIETTRGTVTDDIKLLQNVGMDIFIQKSTQNRYSLASRLFDQEELILLADAVKSAKFITKDKSTGIVQKLSALASKFAAPDLVRHIDVENRVKTENEQLYHIIYVMNDAANRGKKVSFFYFSYDVNKKPKLKNGGQPYIFSPYEMIRNEDYYYAVGYSEKHHSIGNFVSSKMVKLS